MRDGPKKQKIHKVLIKNAVYRLWARGKIIFSDRRIPLLPLQPLIEVLLKGGFIRYHNKPLGLFGYQEGLLLWPSNQKRSCCCWRVPETCKRVPANVKFWLKPKKRKETVRLGKDLSSSEDIGEAIIQVLDHQVKKTINEIISVKSELVI